MPSVLIHRCCPTVSATKNPLHQLGLGEKPMELIPESVVREARVPDDRARVCERGLFPLVERVRVEEVEEIVVVLLGEPLLSSLDRPWDASVGALDRLGDVDPAQLLELVIEDSFRNVGSQA